MAAASADIPALVLPTGPMMTGHYRGERLGACTDCRRFWGMYRAGELDESEIEDVNGRLCPTAGTCMVMGTASTMACMTEALGLMLPGGATIPAVHADRQRFAEVTGRRAVAIAAEDLRPVRILTEDAFHNALVTLQAIGGSTNGLVHITAVANRVGIEIDLDEFDAIGRRVPVLVDLKPYPQEARRARRQGHGAHFGCPHERDRVRHHRPSRQPGVRNRWAACARRDRRLDSSRCAGPAT